MGTEFKKARVIMYNEFHVVTNIGKLPALILCLMRKHEFDLIEDDMEAQRYVCSFCGQEKKALFMDKNGIVHSEMLMHIDPKDKLDNNFIYD